MHSIRKGRANGMWPAHCLLPFITSLVGTIFLLLATNIIEYFSGDQKCKANRYGHHHHIKYYVRTIMSELCQTSIYLLVSDWHYSSMYGTFCCSDTIWGVLVMSSSIATALSAIPSRYDLPTLLHLGYPVRRVACNLCIVLQRYVRGYFLTG